MAEMKEAVEAKSTTPVEKNRQRAALRRTVLGRFARSISVSFWVMVICFLLLRLSPGDPVRIAAGADATEEQIQEMRRRLNLDDPIYVQFWTYVKDIFHGNLGVSLFSQRDVTEILGTHLPVTLMLIFLSILLALILALPLALSVALSKRQSVTYLFRASTAISLSIPGFFLALIGLLFFGIKTTWAPAAGYVGDFPENLRYLWLPALVNCGSLVPVLSRVLHSSLVDTLDEEFVETGVIRGVRKLRFYWSYLLRPSLAPTVVLLSYMVGVMIGGTVIMETIFSLPGIGRELITAVTGRDFPVVQGIVMIFGLIVVFFSFTGDLLGYLLDRRVTLS